VAHDPPELDAAHDELFGVGDRVGHLLAAPRRTMRAKARSVASDAGGRSIPPWSSAVIGRGRSRGDGDAGEAHPGRLAGTAPALSGGSVHS
jgi:hypothetical protein